MLYATIGVYEFVFKHIKKTTITQENNYTDNNTYLLNKSKPNTQYKQQTHKNATNAQGTQT